jgi:uncharacterized protein YciI
MLMVICVSAISTIVTVAQESNQAPPAEMSQYFLGLIYKGEQWASIPPEKVAEVQKAHRANIVRLEQAGQMLLAGPVDDAGELRGIFIYHTATLAEAEELVNTDPAVQAGRLRVEVYPLWAPKALENLSR